MFALVLAIIPAGNTEVQAAAKKPGAITKITKVKTTQDSLTIKFSKAKNKTGYQVRAYKGKKLAKSAKTKKTTYTIKGLKANTKYAVKVRAYGKRNGRTVYGKEKSVTCKTAKAPAKAPAKTPAPVPAPISDTEDDEDKIVLPGQSASTGAKLVAEYEAWIADYAKDETGKIHDAAWEEFNVAIAHFPAAFNYAPESKNDKYQAFKTAQADLDTMNEMLADLLEAIGLKNVSICDNWYTDYAGSTLIVCDLEDGWMIIYIKPYPANKGGLAVCSGVNMGHERPEWTMPGAAAMPQTPATE